MRQGRATITENPRIRIPTIDESRLRYAKTSMIGLLEIDISRLRAAVRDLHRRGLRFSLTSCLIKMVGDCVAAHNEVQASLIGVRKLATFDDVDICISIERSLGGARFPFPLIIRAANGKSVLEIDREIRHEVETEIADENELFLPRYRKIGRALLALFYGLPSRLRVATMRLMLKDPHRAKQILGTVGFATVGMAGRLSGWAFPDRNPYGLYLALGSITRKPVVEAR